MSAGYPIHIEICAHNTQTPALSYITTQCKCDVRTYRAHGVILVPSGKVSKEGLHFLHRGIHYTTAHETGKGEAGRSITDTTTIGVYTVMHMDRLGSTK